MRKINILGVIIGGIILIAIIGYFASEEYRCKVSGGHWGQLSLDPQKYCNPATLDAGKECTDESQCDGYCEAKRNAVIGSKDIGMCSEYELESGCTTAIVNGTVFSWCE